MNNMYEHYLLDNHSHTGAAGPLKRRPRTSSALLIILMSRSATSTQYPEAMAAFVFFNFLKFR